MTVSSRLRGVALTAAAVTTFSGIGTALAAPTPVVPTADCATPATLTILDFNDFHGRLDASRPNTLAFVTAIEAERAAAGDANALVMSSGDNIGATLFPSFIQNDQPTIDLLNAMDLEVSAVGNHEFDRGWPDLRDRVIKNGTNAEFPYLAANVYQAGTQTPVLPAYRTFTKSGLTVAVIGVVTGDLKSLVSPGGITGLDVGDPVAAVNRVAGQLKDGNAANGEADVIIASYHEGAPTSKTLAENQAASAIFNRIVTETASSVNAIFNGHTHQQYAYTGTRPVVQAGSYASHVAKVVLEMDPATGSNCSATATNIQVGSTVDLTKPRVAAAKTVLDAALAQASSLGSQVIGTASAPIGRAMDFTKTPPTDDRMRESTMSNMVAQMFYETLSGGDKNFIGVQNPGGTRADFDAGDISYSEAAAVLPFANSLMTTKLTGAQFKKVLEQQWQRDDQGQVPSRPFLALGLSDNVSFTYDESLAEGSRITSIMINGLPMDPAATYTIGSGSFLITGGDNFWEFKNGTNPVDTGRADLEAWVDWIKGKQTVSPDYRMRGASVHTAPTELTLGAAASAFAVGVPQGPTALDTLDFKTSGVVNTTLTATINGVRVGTGPVASGQVPALTVTLSEQALAAWLATKPTTNRAVLTLTAEPSKSQVLLPVTLKYPISVTAMSAGTKPAGDSAYVWGRATNAPHSRVSVQALVNGAWSTSQVGTTGGDGSYVLPLTYGSNVIGTQTFRVVVSTPVGTAVSAQFTLQRTVPQVTVTSFSAGTKPVEQTTYVWGSASNAAGARVSVQVQINGAWSVSRVGTVAANTTYKLPLTYGSNTPGTYRYRVVVSTAHRNFVGREFTLTRTLPSVVVSAYSAGAKPVGQPTHVWGSATNAAGARVSVQVLVNRAWSVSQVGTVAANTAYKLPLTYGSNVLGTYTFRVVVTTKYGNYVSKQFTLQRT